MGSQRTIKDFNVNMNMRNGSTDFSNRLQTMINRRLYEQLELLEVQQNKEWSRLLGMKENNRSFKVEKLEQREICASTIKRMYLTFYNTQPYPVVFALAIRIMEFALLSRKIGGRYLSCLATASFYLAVKFIEDDRVEDERITVHQLVKLNLNSWTHHDLRRMELRILTILDWQIPLNTYIGFLPAFMRALNLHHLDIQTVNMIYTKAEQLLMDNVSFKMKPSEVALTALLFCAHSAYDDKLVRALKQKFGMHERMQKMGHFLKYGVYWKRFSIPSDRYCIDHHISTIEEIGEEDGAEVEECGATVAEIEACGKMIEASGAAVEEGGAIVEACGAAVEGCGTAAAEVDASGAAVEECGAAVAEVETSGAAAAEVHEDGATISNTRSEASSDSGICVSSISLYFMESNHYDFKESSQKGSKYADTNNNGHEASSSSSSDANSSNDSGNIDDDVAIGSKCSTKTKTLKESTNTLPENLEHADNNVSLTQHGTALEEDVNVALYENTNESNPLKRANDNNNAATDVDTMRINFWNDILSTITEKDLLKANLHDFYDFDLLCDDLVLLGLQMSTKLQFDPVICPTESSVPVEQSTDSTAESGQADQNDLGVGDEVNNTKGA